MLQKIQNGFHAYVEALPRDIPTIAIKSAAYSFMISYVFSKNLRKGLVSAAVGATLSVISGLMTAFIKTTFAHDPERLSWAERGAARVLSIAATQLICQGLQTQVRVIEFLLVDIIYRIFNMDREEGQGCPIFIAAQFA